VERIACAVTRQFRTKRIRRIDKKVVLQRLEVGSRRVGVKRRGV
jgi:hypothetical protein